MGWQDRLGLVTEEEYDAYIGAVCARASSDEERFGATPMAGQVEPTVFDKEDE